jgi:hypothetical protein
MAQHFVHRSRKLSAILNPAREDAYRPRHRGEVGVPEVNIAVDKACSCVD